MIPASWAVLAALLVAPGGDASDAAPRVVDVRASSFALSSQAETTVAVAPDGRVLVAWSSRRQQEGRSDVRGQWLDATLRPIGLEFPLAGPTPSIAPRVAPAIAFDAAGAAWAAWQEHPAGFEDGQVVLRRLDDGFEPPLPGAAARRGQPILVAAAGASPLLLWSEAATDVAAPRLAAARIVEDRLEPIALCFDEESPWSTPAACIGPAGSILFAAARAEEDGRPLGIFVQRSDERGNPIGSPHRASPWESPGAIEPVVAAGGAGWIVAWYEPAPSGHRLVARALDRAGRPAAAPVVIADDVVARGSAILATPEGALLAWTEYGDGAGDLRHVRLDAAARPIAPPAAATAHRAGPQQLRPASAVAQIARAADGAVLLAFSGDADLGDGSAAHLARIAGPALPERVRPGVTEAMVATATIDRPTGAAEPHQPPTFDPRRRARRDSELGAGPGTTGFPGFVNTGWNPPDPQMAVGPDHIVAIVNGGIAYLNKQGQLLFEDEIEGPGGFWGSLGATGFVFDPEVHFDRASQRFFAMAVEGYAPPDQTKSYVLLAVSDNANPVGQWYKYRLETTSLAGNLFDSPNLAIGDDSVLVAGDAFGLGAVYACFVWDKASLLAGAAPATEFSFTLPTTTLSAGAPPAAGAGGVFYFVEHAEGPVNTTLRVIAVKNALLGTPSVATAFVTVPGYGDPEDPPQQGTTFRPRTFDARFWSVKRALDGTLWATHHADSDRVRVRWYQIDVGNWPTSGSPSLVQSGIVDPGGDARTYFSAIGVADHGDVAVVYARSSPGEFISMRSRRRCPADPPGTLGPESIHRTNSAAWSSDRWGDYAEVAVDPADGRTLWLHHEYATGGTWRTWIQRLDPERDVADLDCDGVVGFNDLVVLLAAWGPCPGCPADIDLDGMVGFNDLVELLSRWNS